MEIGAGRGGLDMKATIASALGLCLFVFAMSKGAALETEPANFFSPPPLTPVVVFGSDLRASPEIFALQHHLDVADLRRRYAATGVVHCGNARGSGQLTLADDVLTTAAHVLYDREGKLRGDADHCRFVVDVDGREISTPIEVAGTIAGSTNPYNESAVHDWAVVKLAHPLKEAEPYPLGTPARDEPVLFVARGAVDWGGGRDMSMQDCRLRAGLEDGAEGTREFSFDCSANVGASGSGLFDEAGKGLMAIFVGYRSIDPTRAMPFSPLHYNFAVTVEGEFRRAVERQASLRTAAQ